MQLPDQEIKVLSPSLGLWRILLPSLRFLLTPTKYLLSLVFHPKIVRSGERMLQPGNQLCSQGGWWSQVPNPHQAGPHSCFPFGRYYLVLIIQEIMSLVNNKMGPCLKVEHLQKLLKVIFKRWVCFSCICINQISCSLQDRLSPAQARLLSLKKWIGHRYCPQFVISYASGPSWVNSGSHVFLGLMNGHINWMDAPDCEYVPVTSGSWLL